MLTPQHSIVLVTYGNKEILDLECCTLSPGRGSGVDKRAGGAYLGDPPAAVGGQGVAGVGEAVLQQASGRGSAPQLGQQQHVVVAVALGQLRRAVDLPAVRGAGDTQRLTAGLQRQLTCETQMCP